jgi:hypothetical protein
VSVALGKAFHSLALFGIFDHDEGEAECSEEEFECEGPYSLDWLRCQQFCAVPARQTRRVIDGQARDVQLLGACADG